MENLTNVSNLRLEVTYDDCPENPREYDNLGTMVCFHRRYNLGDRHSFTTEDFNSWDELEKMLYEQKDAQVVLPLYLYDHSGITISTSPFSCRWDSGQLGFIYISKSKVKEEGLQVDKVSTYLENEVDMYDKYLTGQVYEYQIIKTETCNLGHTHEEVIDSCRGYYSEEEANEAGEQALKYYNNQ